MKYWTNTLGDGRCGEGGAGGEAGAVRAGVAGELVQPGLVGLDPGSQPGGGLTTPLALRWRRCVWWACVLRVVVHCFPGAH